MAPLDRLPDIKPFERFHYLSLLESAALHEAKNFIVIANNPEDNPVGQLKNNPVMNVDADLPVISVKVLEPHSGPERRFSVKVGQDGFN